MDIAIFGSKLFSDIPKSLEFPIVVETVCEYKIPIKREDFYSAICEINYSFFTYGVHIPKSVKIFLQILGSISGLDNFLHIPWK